MIRVIHYDYRRYESHRIRERLATELVKYPEVDYLDYRPESEIFDFGRVGLEKILPEKDVLLIHPGVKGQAIVLGYPAIFPKLRIAFVIGGEFQAYPMENGVMVIDGYRTDEIVKFILSKPA